MQHALMVKLALGCAGIFTSGSLAGLALANYVESGSFHFYREASVRESSMPREIRPVDFVVAAPPAASHEAGLLQHAAFER